MDRQSMFRGHTLAVSLCSALVLACGGREEHGTEGGYDAGAQAQQPNVLLILADDLGWMDVSMHGSRFHRTPNIDALAARGMRFSQAYSASPLCSPTRASILTGRDPARHGVTAPMGHLPEHILSVELPRGSFPDRRAITPNTATRIAFEHETLPEAFLAAGYDTALFGKWHLGGGPHAPTAHGFETVLGGGPHPGPPSYFAPFGIDDLPSVPDGTYLTDTLVEGAVDWLQEGRDKPFFACLWFYSVHAPFQARTDLREEAMGRVDPADPQHSPTYAAMVNSLDDGVGRVLETLARLNLDQNTIVIFASDNGGNQYDTIYGDVPGSPRSGVAPTRNLPLRGGKGTIWEGGVRVPMAVAWPQAVADGRLEPGSVSDALVTSTDLYPSLLELAGLAARPEQALDGISFVPALLGKEAARKEVVVHFPHDFPISGNRAATSIRVGDDKLIRFWADGEGGADRNLLFDLGADGSESKDLGAQRTELFAELSNTLDAYLKQTEAVYPRANPGFDPATERWIAGEDVLMEYSSQATGTELLLTAKGEHPWIATPYVGGIVGHLTFECEIASESRGPFELFWAVTNEAGLSRTRSASAAFEPNGEWQTLRLEFDAQAPLAGFRIDPFRGVGQGSLRNMRLLNIGGDVVREWRP